MIKKIMVVFFGAFAVLIVLSFVLLSGKMTLLPSPDSKTVYELRIRDGRLQHALRHGGVQIFSWSDIVLEDESGKTFAPKSIGVKRSNSRTGEFEIEGFPENVRLLVRVTDAFVASAFYNLPAGKTIERVEIRPEPGASGTEFCEESTEGLGPGAAKPFIFIAPKADGGDTYLVYHHTDMGVRERPRFIYRQADFAPPLSYDATTVYDESIRDGLLHVLYFSDSPVLLREIYEAGVPASPFPTLLQNP